jgi:hypothetical protein
MFGSTVLEVAIGMTFCYASVALITSTLQEALASLMRLRARSLLGGVKSMLNDPGFARLARAVYQHALVNPHDDGMAGDPHAIKNKPSYIEPEHFAIALVDALHSVPGDFDQLGRDIAGVADPQVRRVLASLHERAGGDIERFRAGVALWFDSAMERVSGAYKRRAQLIGVLITLLLAILCDIDSVHLFRVLWRHPALAAQLGAAPGALDPKTLAQLSSLPIGWEAFPPAVGVQLLPKVAGWLLTASTALFGAPFWFDLLQRMVQVRGTGAKPSERKNAPES